MERKYDFVSKKLKVEVLYEETMGFLLIFRSMYFCLETGLIKVEKRMCTLCVHPVILK